MTGFSNNAAAALFKRKYVYSIKAFSVFCKNKKQRQIFLIITVILFALLYWNFYWNKENGKKRSTRPCSTSYNREWNIATRRKVTKYDIGILVIIDKRGTDDDFKVARNSLSCYAKLFNYPLQFVYISEEENLEKDCPQKDFMLKRHCFAAHYITKHNWTLFLDGDIGVINPYHTIEEYVDDTVNIIFYDRIFNWEVMAGSYLIRNSSYSVEFLHTWANFDSRLPQSFHGTDNGVLHMILMEQLAPMADAERTLCERLLNKSQGIDDLFVFEACARLVLGANRYWPGKVKIIRKALGWSRDGWTTETKFCKRDFMFHGWKLKKLNGEWTMPFLNPEALVSCTSGFAAFATYCDYESTIEEIEAMLLKMTIEVEKDFYSHLYAISKALE